MASVQELNALRAFFNRGISRPFEFREAQLKKLRDAVKKYEQPIYDALYADLKKSPEESWVTENGFLLSEINYAIKNLQSWMKPQRTGTNLLNFPSSSFVLSGLPSHSFDKLGTIAVSSL